MSPMFLVIDPIDTMQVFMFKASCGEDAKKMLCTFFEYDEEASSEVAKNAIAIPLTDQQIAEISKIM